MNKRRLAAFVPYLVVCLAEGPLAFAQPDAQAPVPAQPAPPPAAPPAAPPSVPPSAAVPPPAGTPSPDVPAPAATSANPLPPKLGTPPPPPPANTTSPGPLMAPGALGGPRRRGGDTFRSSVRRTGTGLNGAAAVNPALRRFQAAAPRAPEAPSTATAPAAKTTTVPSTGASGTVTVQNTGGEGVTELPGEKEFNQCKKLPAGKRILKFNFKPDSEISDLIGWISTISCTQFLISGPPLQGKKVTILSPQLITPEEAYRLFLGALESVGLTVEPMGKFLRIVETGRARFSPMPVYKNGEEPPAGDKRYVTRLFRFENLDAADVLANLYNQVRGEQGVGVAYQGSLIATDQAVMLDRFSEIVHELDIPTGSKEKIWMVRVRNTSATEMATRLAEIFSVQQMGTGGRRTGANGAPVPPPAPPPPANAKPTFVKKTDLASQLSITKLIPDERSNQLIVVASEQAYEWLLTILKKLDVPLEGGGDGRFHIYYCAHANCDELAATLSAVTGVSIVGGGARRTSRTSTPGQAAPPPVPTPTPGLPGQAQALPQLFEGDVRVTFDAATNSLVVYSSLKDFQSLRRVIDKLDAPRKQIYVEAMIMEVLLDKSRDVGVAYHAGIPTTVAGKQSVVIGGYDAGKTLSPASLASDLVGLAGGIFGPALDASASRLFGTQVDIPSFGAYIKLLQNNNNVNVLSTPHLLITNNQEGEISVGQRLPFPGAFTNGFTGLGSTATSLVPQVSVQREDVSLRMKLAPSVNESNVIRIDVDVEISDLASTNFNGLGPATTKRTAKTPIVCKDQQTVVIGGLMSDRQTDTVEKVPILGDIPVLGFFFRNTHKQIVKSNIIIALTPYVISDMDDLRRVAEQKMRERREFIERFTSVEDIAPESSIDYSRKRGMLEEINSAAKEIDDEEAALRQVRQRDLQDESTPIELPTQSRPARPPGASAEPPATKTIPSRERAEAPPAALPGASNDPVLPARTRFGLRNTSTRSR